MNEKNQFKDCMKDAGMDSSSIETCLTYIQMGEIGCGRKLLQEYRTKLLKEIQKKHQQLNCLDYLMESDEMKMMHLK